MDGSTRPISHNCPLKRQFTISPSNEPIGGELFGEHFTRSVLAESGRVLTHRGSAVLVWTAEPIGESSGGRTPVPDREDRDRVGTEGVAREGPGIARGQRRGTFQVLSCQHWSMVFFSGTTFFFLLFFFILPSFFCTKTRGINFARHIASIGD